MPSVPSQPEPASGASTAGAPSEDFDPPDWACDAFLKTISADAKMAARFHGKPGVFPGPWTMVDAVLYWWETDGRPRWLLAAAPDGREPSEKPVSENGGFDPDGDLFHALRPCRNCGGSGQDGEIEGNGEGGVGECPECRGSGKDWNAYLTYRRYVDSGHPMTPPLTPEDEP